MTSPTDLLPSPPPGAAEPPPEPPPVQPTIPDQPPGGPTMGLAAVLLLTLSGVALFAAGLSLGGQGAGRGADEQAAVAAFIEAYRRINDEYIGESEPSRLLEGAIEGMFETLDDPYSAYLAPDEFESTFADISGEFEGIGARMNTEDAEGVTCPLIGEGCELTVFEVLPDTPAMAAGLLAADIVRAVDGRSLVGRTIDDAVMLIRGPRDSEVRLTLDRAGEDLQLAIRRGVIVSQDVRSAVLEDGRVGYLRIDGFSSGVSEGFEAALREHLDAGISHLILDVRDDPGGFVDAAVDISSQFLPDGPVFWEEDAAGTQRPVEVTGGGLAVDPSIEVVVLVDDGTASASEILAGALQDAGRAELVGERTFGKGTVQEWTQLPGQSGGFRLSIAKWLTRDKTWVHEVGLTPDMEVPDDGGRFWPTLGDEPTDEDAVAADAQLQRAIELLLDADGDAGGETAPPNAPATPGASATPGTSLPAAPDD